MLILVFDTQEELDKFTLLYKKYAATIYYTLTRYQLDEYTKEDLSQEIYLKLAEHLNDIDIDNFKKTQNYIITITRNYTLNYLRSKNRKSETFLDDIPVLQSTASDILEQLISKEQILFLAAEINKLDDIYKSVLELKYVSLSKRNHTDIRKICSI